MSPTERTTFRNTVQVHEATGDTQHHVMIGNRVDATLTLEDGRTVQVCLLNNGQVLLRAWAAEPYATDNRDACTVSFALPTLEDMVLDGAQVSEVSMRTSALTERSLVKDGDVNGCWYLATDKIKQRVEAIRTLLALRRPERHDLNGTN